MALEQPYLPDKIGKKMFSSLARNVYNLLTYTESLNLSEKHPPERFQSPFTHAGMSRAQLRSEVSELQAVWIGILLNLFTCHCWAECLDGELEGNITCVMWPLIVCFFLFFFCSDEYDDALFFLPVFQL